MKGFPAAKDTSPLTLDEPIRRTSAAVFSSPHSGRDYPKSLVERSRLKPALLLRSSEDAFVDELFAAAPEFGAPLLKANFPRAWVDANRAVNEIDPVLVSNPPAQRLSSPRAAAGLGVAPRVVSEGRQIYDGAKIRYEEVCERVAACHQPYHAALEDLMTKTRRRFGAALLIDCHSMPSESVRHGRDKGPEIILGDRHGLSANSALIAEAMKIFEEAGFRATRNSPFAGGHITQSWGRPEEGFHALQIEINRGLYLNEAKVERAPEFEAFRAKLRPAIQRLAHMQALAALMRPLADHRFAAE